MPMDLRLGRRRLRLGMVGGGRGGGIGRSHRAAALIDGRWELVAGALSSDPERARASAADWLIDPDRAYTSYRDMAQREASRPDRIDAVAICTPNDTHHAIARTFLDHGFHVICDKPMTTKLEDALDLVQAVRRAGLVFGVTHTYSGYPMVRMAREMIAAGEVGEIRSVAVEYISQYQAKLGDPDHWEVDPQRCGPVGCVGVIGTHAHHMASFVTGLKVVELSAELASLLPGHRLDDHATMHLRFENGARGLLWCTTVAPGVENGLRFRVFGSRGGLEWAQENPNQMLAARLNQQPRILTRGGFEETPSAAASCRIPAGHPEGYLEAFANLYSELAMLILAPENAAPQPQRLCPTVEDGARGVRFMYGARESHEGGGRWVEIGLDL